MKIAILGGGLTGVTLARLLHMRGNDVIVLEKDHSYGGLCRSLCSNGFTIDIGGSHIVFSRDTEVLNFMRDVLRENKNLKKRNTKILYKGYYVKYPFENGLYQLDKDDRFYCLNEFIKVLIAGEKGALQSPRNFLEWMYNTFGKGISELYLIPYNEKIWKFPCAQMSCHWVDGRIPRPPVEDIIRSAIGIETEGYVHQAQFTYPIVGGIEALVHAIAEPIREKIITDFPVTLIKERNGSFLISDGNETIAVDTFISTIPVQNLLPCLNGVPEEVKQACSDLKYNSLYCVFVGIRGEVPDISWVYVPDRATGLFNRLSFPSNYSPSVAPPGHSSILVEITFREGDDVDTMEREDVVSHVIDSLMTLKLIRNRKDVVFTHVERQKFAYVIYDLNYLPNIAVVKEFCQSRNIHLVGRFSQFEYLNMDGCIRNALDFVRKFS